MEALVRWLIEDPRIGHSLAVAFLVAARLAPITVLAPWMTLRDAPATTRGAVMLALSAALAPLAAASAPVEFTGGAWVVGALALREVLLGTVFALASALPLYALDWGGRLVDIWRGASMAEVIAPPTGERTSPLGDAYLLGGVALFAVVGGHRLAFAAFAGGLSVAPVGVVPAAATVAAVAGGAGRLIASALAFGVAVAAPAAAALVAVEVSLGLVARAAPQIPVFFAGMPLRGAVGIAALLLATNLLFSHLPVDFADALATAEVLLRRMASGR